MAEELQKLIALSDYEVEARKCIGEMAYEYLASGVADDVTLAWNRQAFDRIQLMPRVLTDVSKIDIGVELFGRRHAAPILLAPTGYHRLFHPEGETETVRGAEQCDTTLVAACFATVGYRAMRSGTTKPTWFQLYIQPDRGFTKALVEEVIDSGCEALCVTVDLPVNSARDRERGVRFALPPGLRRENLYRTEVVPAGMPTVVDRTGIYNAVRAPDVTWKDIEWLRSFVPVPLLLKGVARAEDARTAVQTGCAGIMVSNHGGRSTDGVPASVDLLPAIAEAVGDSTTLLLDGGIRRGTDVLKALALGADAVMIGRPYLYGLAVNGAQGIADVVKILRTELMMAMGNTGYARLRDIDRGLLAVPPFYL